MITHYTKWDQPINADLLLQELKAELGDLIVGIIYDGEQIAAHFDDTAGEITQEVLLTAVDILHAHDWRQSTPEQERAEQDADAGRVLFALIDERVAWHEANPVTRANAVTVAARIQEEWVYFLRLLRSGQLRI